MKLRRAGIAGWVLLIAIFGVWASARSIISDPAATMAVTPAADELGQGPIIVSVLTIMPGEGIHADYGHTALRIRHRAGYYDAVFNYGTFDFREQAFAWKFIWGRLNYYLSVEPFDQTLAFSEFEGRPIVEQVLNLTESEARAILDWLREMAQPENAYYRYKFLTDNCSTRVRDVLVQHVVGTSWTPMNHWAPDLTPRLSDTAEGVQIPAWRTQSFREMVGVYTADKPWLWVGESALLGPRTDEQPPGSWPGPLGYSVGELHTRESAAMFLPLPLMAVLEASTRSTRDGPRPMVASTRTYPMTRADGTVLTPDDATRASVQPGFPWPAIVFGVVLLTAVVLTALSYRTRRVKNTSGVAASSASPPGREPLNERWFVRIFDAGLLLLTGLLGTLAAMMWLFSEHEVLHRNAHLLWAWPTHLIAALLLVGPKRWRAGRVFNTYCVVAGLLGSGGAVAAVVVQDTPLALMFLAAALLVRIEARGLGGRFAPWQ